MTGAALLLAAALLANAAPYDDAKASFDSGDHPRAAAAFAALVDSSPADAALRYDLGNALFKSGRLGPAIASYQRAFELDPRDSDIRHNLDFALRKAGEELVPSGVPAPAFAAFTALSARELSGLHWLAAWTFLILAGLAALGDAARRERLFSAVLAGGAAWALFGLWWAGLRAVLPPGRAVIVTARAELRNGPGERYSVGYTAPEGRRVRILSESGGWLEVGLLKEGVKGWTPVGSIEKL